MLDLVIITPDGAYPVVLEAMLGRPQALGIRPLTRQIVKDALHDSSGNTVDLLRPYLGKCRHALLVRDFEGSGWGERGAPALTDELVQSAIANGWSTETFAAVVVEPEIETWLRMPSTHLENLVREKARRNRDYTQEQIRTALEEIVQTNGGRGNDGKPFRPKESFAEFLRLFGMPFSNSHYKYLAEKESLHRCTSESLNRLTGILRRWFPAQTGDVQAAIGSADSGRGDD